MLFRHIAPLECKRVLEVGAGSAKDSVRLTELGANAYAIDYCGAALSLAERLCSARGVKLSLAQANTLLLPFQDCIFDAVFSQGLLEHLTSPRAALQEQSRVLKPGGILLADVPQKYHPYSLYKWFQMKRGRWFAGWETSFSLKELEEMFFACGLSVVDSYGDGYWPRAFLAIRNLHTFAARHNLRIGLPTNLASGIEEIWRLLEGSKLYYRYMWNIGVVARKPK